MRISAALIMAIFIASLPTSAPSQQSGDNSAVQSDAQLQNEPGGPLQHRGSGQFTAAPEVEDSASATDDGAPKLDIAFERAPVGLVVQSLLSDLAGASVVIDPRVQGEITIRSQGQLSARELPGFLRSSVQAMGLELIEQAPNAFLLRPQANSAEGASPQVHQFGQQTHSGLVIYGLRFVPATDMARLLQPFTGQGVVVQPERNREMLILSGPPDQVRTLVQTIELFDVDWLEGMSFGVAPLEYANPATLIEELHVLFGGADGPIGSMVEFVPLPSRRAILILAKRPERLDQARNWIAQLDRPMQVAGRLRFIQIQNSDAENIAETLAALFTETDAAAPRITADTGRNALIVQSDPAVFEEISALVRELDAPIDQVMIEVTIAEVGLNNDLRYGLQWSFDTRDGGQVTLSEASNGAIAARFPGFSYGYTGNYVRAALNALSSRTHVEVISSPVVVTLDNQEAVLQIGDEVPIVTQSATNVTTADATVVNTVQYRETGILLRVTPRISRDGSVTLEVVQEASEVAPTTTSGIDSPTIQQRRFQSTVTIANGDTIALGGLIRATRSRTRAGVPVLSSIPVLGIPFRSNNEAVRRTELLVFLTPRIIRSGTEARAASDDLTQRLRRIRNSRFIERYDPRN
jgi:general secretion pathway protein D